MTRCVCHVGILSDGLMLLVSITLRDRFSLSMLYSVLGWCWAGWGGLGVRSDTIDMKDFTWRYIERGVAYVAVSQTLLDQGGFEDGT